MQKNAKRISIGSDLSLLLITIIWGTGFSVTRMALDYGIGTNMIMAVRFIIASIITAIVFRKKLKNFTKTELTYGIISGVLLFGGFITQTIGLEYTIPSNSAFLTSTTVVMVPFITWVMIKRKPTKKVISAMLASIMGIAVLTRIFDTSIKFNIGDLLTLACAFLFASHMVFLEISSSKLSTEKLAYLQFMTSAVLSVLVLVMFDLKSVDNIQSMVGFLPVIYLGLFSTCLALFVQTRAMKDTHSSKVAIIVSSEAVFASIFSVILGYETTTISLLVGGLLMMTAVVIMEKEMLIQMIKSLFRRKT